MSDALDRLKATLAETYAINRELGRGGMATVYLAEDLKQKRQVAVKVLSGPRGQARRQTCRASPSVRAQTLNGLSPRASPESWTDGGSCGAGHDLR